MRVYRHNNPQLIDQSERAHWFGYYINTNKEYPPKYYQGMGLSTTGEQRNTEYFKLKYSPSSPESIMRGSNCHTTDHHRTVPWVELSPVHQFCRFRKAFDSVDIDTLWKLLRHYGVPVKIVNIIRSSYEGLPCSVIHRGQPTEMFRAK